MNLINILYLISFFAVTVIFFMLLTRRYKSDAIKSLTIMLFSFSGWNLFSLLRVSLFAQGSEMLILYFLRFFWSVSGICFLFFIYDFINRKKDFLFYIFILNQFIGMILLFFTNLFFMDGVIKTKYGIVGIYSEFFVEFVLLFFITPILFAVFLIVKDIIDNKNITDSKEHFRIILYTLVTLTFIISVDILLGSFDSSSSAAFGNIFVTLFSVFLYCTVVKNRNIFSGFDVLCMNFLDQITNPIIITDEKDKIIHINKNAELLKKEILGKEFKEELSIKKVETNPLEIKYLKGQKKYFYQVFFYSSYIYGNEAGKTYIFNDITDNKKIQYELDLKISDLKRLIKEKESEIDQKKYEYKNEEMLYKDLFEVNDESLFLIELEDFRIIKVNKKVLKTYGYMKKEVEGMDANLLSHDYEASIRKFISVIKRNGTLPVTFYKHKKKNGEIFPVEIRAFIFNVENRKVMLALVKDLSEYSRNKKALIVSQRLSVASLVLNNISNNFYNLYLDIEKKVKLLYREKNNHLKGMFENVSKALLNGKALLREVIDYSENKKMNKKNVEIFETYIKNMLHHERKFKRLNIEFYHKENIGKGIKIKEEDFDRIILILLSNAEHAVFYRDKRKIEVECEQIDNKLCIKVKDNGVGIERQYSEKIFEPFFSLKGKNASEESPWRNINAIGMGLSVLESIVKDYNGIINVNSVYDKGSIFEIILFV